MHNIKPIKHANFENRFWKFLIFGLFLYSILRGIRFPNMWSYSHFLFNYDFGFIKRGLIGEIIKQLNSPYLASYDSFLVFSFAIFCANIVLLFYFMNDSVNSQNPILICCSLIFASSLGVVFLSHTVGYSDQIGLLITLLTLKLSGFYKKSLFLFLAMPFALLIHEAIFITFFPVIFMALLLSIESEGQTKKILLLGAFSAILLIFVVFLSNHTLDETQAHEMYTGLQAERAYPLREDAFNTLHRTSKDNFQVIESKWSTKKTTFLELANSLLVTAPSFIVFIYFTNVILKEAKVKYYIRLLSILASLSPLLLHFWGWDLHRWNTLTVTTSFIIQYITNIKYKNQLAITSDYIYALLAVVLFLNIGSTIPLLDGYIVKQYPFIEHQNYIIDLILRKETFPYIPSR